MLLGFYNYTVVLTYISLFISTIGIFFSMAGDFKLAVICLMLSGLCDMFDGKVASTMERTKEEKRFGIQIDSLSDLVCFGVLPAVILYRIRNGSLDSILIGGFYVLCALIRLSYFNVMEEMRQDETNEKRETYQGLPVTTIAVILPFFFILSSIWTAYLSINLSSLMFSAVLLIVAILFLSPISVKKFGLRGMTALGIIGMAELILILYRRF